MANIDKYPKNVVSQNRGDVIKSLENEENDLGSDLKK